MEDQNELFSILVLLGLN